MRPSLLLCSLLLCLGCARSVEPTQRPTDAASPEAGGELAPPAPAVTDAGPVAEAECRSDADCAVTNMPEGECCPTLCTGRVVTAREAQGLLASERACVERGEPCALPPCAPPRSRIVPVCTGGRCTARMVPMESP
ncbi:hypothetical protein [Pyxidicoccus xibeiensis]|uniref:hypothetical protein n=1 Tax=Pyxidicoccus xibeiensis TaxID=2906759 RepID=UPI0020A7069C|nr:hypothetical protein [Pyxidicoccus xibeiensis]MCP3145063.1 hypothetical protein [Pyxidicoccus xibeiensis]